MQTEDSVLNPDTPSINRHILTRIATPTIQKATDEACTQFNLAISRYLQCFELTKLAKHNLHINCLVWIKIINEIRFFE